MLDPLELDPIYVDVAVRRWQAYTGKSAVHPAAAGLAARRSATVSKVSPDARVERP